MKIKYDLTNNYFKYFNEGQGVYLYKKYIDKKENKKIYGYLETNFFNLGLSMLLYVINNLLIKNGFLYRLIDFLTFMAIFVTVFCIINFYVLYFHEKKATHKGTLEINEFGITDYSEENVNIGLGWDKIDSVVVSKNLITILNNSNMPIIIFIENDKEDKIVKSIKKYKNDIKIINLKR